jgi:transposase InsO family protein
MPWQESSIMSLRLEFIRLAFQKGVSFRELCRRFGISTPTGYKWVSRCAAAGSCDLRDRSRRPHSSPTKTADILEQAVLEQRRAHPTWGGRKIAARLIALEHADVPAPSTITQILRRHGALDNVPRASQTAPLRFEYEHPNALWQMDFKGHFALEQGRCHPLTILDDHSRYNIAVRACSNEQGETVHSELQRAFRMYGLPERMLMDNGPTWSGQGRGLSKIEAWLMRLDIRVLHGRPVHPQTQGKDERFHRTLKADVLQFNTPKDLPACQKAFDEFRHVYNQERPHEALGLKPPISRYKPSARAYPESLPPIEYAPQDVVRKVSEPGQLRFQGRRIIVGKGLTGQQVAIRPTLEDGIYEIIYCATVVRRINLRNNQQEL